MQLLPQDCGTVRSWTSLPYENLSQKLAQTDDLPTRHRKSKVSLLPVVLLSWPCCPRRSTNECDSLLAMPLCNRVSILGSRRCTLELSFGSKELRTICEQESVAEKRLGRQIAEILKHRLADLRAATSYTDLIAGNPHLAIVGSIESLVLDLAHRSQIVLQANHPQNPYLNGREIDWAQVSRVKVTRVGGEHE